MRRATKNTALALFLILVCTGTSATDQNKGKRRIKVKLIGFQEVPAVSSRGSGEFRAKIDEDDAKIDFKLTWSNLEGGAVQQAHIHFGQHSVNGGVAAFFCTNLAPPAGPLPPPCPGPESGTVEGTLRAENIIGPAGQGIGPEEFAELLRAIRTGNAYVNVHTEMWPGGEIRAQLPARERGRLHDDEHNAEQEEEHNH